MRLKIYFVSALLLLTGVRASACSPYRCLPQDYMMFRVYDKEVMRSWDPDIAANCEAWQALTDAKVSTEDIRQVVYGYSLYQLHRLMSYKKTTNSFEKYISTSRDRETANFLILAKTCELSRSEMADPW